MANVRVVSFALEGDPDPATPFTFHWRLNTGERWLSRGLSDTANMRTIIEEDLDACCSVRTRMLLRTDDGSGKEVSIAEILGIIEKDTVLGGGRLKCLNIVAYPKSPFPDDQVVVVEEEENKKKCDCCVLQ